MKTIIFCLLLFFFNIRSFAQEAASWQIKHDKQIVFSAKSEDEKGNSKTLSSADFTKKGCYYISYKEKNTSPSRDKWIRTIAFYDEADKELLRKQSTTVKIKDADLKKMLQENKTIKIYTWSLPKDPKEAARIRVRRVHLCSIVLSD